MNRLVAAAVSSVCLAASAATAEEPSAPPPVARLDREGFYGRLSLNGGYRSLATDRYDYASLGTGFSLAAGHAVIENLYLFAELTWDLALDPSASESGHRIFFDGLEMRFLSLGPGAAYYLPSDFYLSATVGWASASVTTAANRDQEAFTGFGAKIGVGKEWRLADRFGFGLGADFFVGTVSRDQPGIGKESATPMGVGLALSGLYD